VLFIYLFIIVTLFLCLLPFSVNILLNVFCFYLFCKYIIDNMLVPLHGVIVDITVCFHS